MKKFFATAICALPFALGGAVYAQGTKGPSGSGAENPSTQSRNNDAQQPGHGQRDTTASDKADNASRPEAGTASPGSPESKTSVAPAQPATPRTTEPDAGRNRSSSGDGAGTEPRTRDDQGAR